MRALEVAKTLRPEILTKSSLMLGLGEARAEVVQVLHDLEDSRCDIVTLGQYLRPSPAQVEVFRYVTPAEFSELEQEARSMGFRNVFSGPLVRSSYHAWKVTESVSPHDDAGKPDAGKPGDSAPFCP